MLVGIQGSGKGTQAKKLVQVLGYRLFDTGAELRKIAATDTELGRKIDAIISRGERVPPEYLRDTIIEFIQRNTGFPLIFDGPIRSNEQDKIIRPILGEYCTIQLELDAETAIARLLHRRVDEHTGEVFPGDFPNDINPHTGNRLITRKDDNEAAIARRIRWSLDEYIPLIARWEAEWHTIHKIDARGNIDEIFNTLCLLISSLSQ